MFGVMRPEKSCASKTASDYRFHRMHYCGTCKALGQQFGHRSRLMLNFDTVFLAELLSLISQANLSEWSPGFQAINQCFKMPEKVEELPLPLKYAATASTLLSELKLDDQLHDRPGIGWKLLRRFFHQTFRESHQQLRVWGIEIKIFQHWIKEQFQIEKKARRDFPSVQALLEFYAEPTAQMTGLIFEKGAKAVGQPEQSFLMHQLGYHFGQLVYTLDAFEDVEKDLARGQFNPLVLYLPSNELFSEYGVLQVRTALQTSLGSVKAILMKLPFAQEFTVRYITRLDANISLRLFKERSAPSKQRTKPHSVWQVFLKKSLAAKNYLRSNLHKPQYYLVSVAGLVIPWAADYVNQGNRAEIYSWAVAFATFLALVGLGRMGSKRWETRKARRKFRRVKRQWRRIGRFQNLKRWFLKRPCLEDCAAACCESCCQGCCEWTCDEGCHWFNDTVCAACGDGMREGKLWPWLVLSLLVIGLASFIVFVLVF